MINYEILQQFVTFYHTGTLREAAELLHISQPTLTRNMQKLEAKFGVALFTRTKNSISLNETGLIAAEDAKMLLRQTENMLNHARDYDRARRTITIGACTPVPVPDVIRRIAQRHPRSAISSEVKNVPQLLEGVRDGSYQFVLLPFAPEEIGFWHDLVVEKMPDSRFLVQTERYSFLELVENSTMPSFTTDYDGHDPVGEAAAIGRVAVPIADPEFNVSYYLVSCLRQNR